MFVSYFLEEFTGREAHGDIQFTFRFWRSFGRNWVQLRFGRYTDEQSKRAMRRFKTRFVRVYIVVMRDDERNKISLAHSAIVKMGDQRQADVDSLIVRNDCK